jgi:hypothetical protein
LDLSVRYKKQKDGYRKINGVSWEQHGKYLSRTQSTSGVNSGKRGVEEEYGEW